MQDIKADLRKFIVDDLGGPASLADDTELFSSGFLDSLSVLALVECFERAAGVRVPLTEIRIENFDSIERMSRFASTLLHAR